MIDLGVWAQEALSLFEDSTSLTKRVHRNFADEFANEGDIVSVLGPYENRTNTPLTDHLWCSFVIQDNEGGRSFNTLARRYLQPAMQALAKVADQRILTCLHNSIDDYMPQLPKITRDNALENVSRASEILDNHAAAADGRSIILDPTSETALLRGMAFEELRTLRLAAGYTILDNESRQGTSFILQWDAVAFVTRPFAQIVPPDQSSVIAHYNDICIRMSMRYDVHTAGTRVTIDMLTGVTILNSNWIVAMVNE
jgi:hypothetical protein